MFEGVIGLIIFILDIVAIVKVFQSTATAVAKILWTLLILILPLLGLIIWFLMGPRPRRA